MTVRAAPGTARGEIYELAMSAVKDRAIDVPVIRSPVYLLVELARIGVVLEDLARIFEIDQEAALILCLHHGVGPKRGARPMAELARAAARPLPPHPPQKSFLELSLPESDR